MRALLISVLVGALVAALLTLGLELWVIGYLQNLTATDRTGSILEDGAITAHGWWSLSWRAGAGGLGGIVLGALLGRVWVAHRLGSSARRA